MFFLVVLQEKLGINKPRGICTISSGHDINISGDIQRGLTP